MSKDDIREITHRNVLRLVDALKAERSRTDNLQQRLEEAETQIRTLLIDQAQMKKRVNEAYAIAQQVKHGTR